MKIIDLTFFFCYITKAWFNYFWSFFILPYSSSKKHCFITTYSNSYLSDLYMKSIIVPENIWNDYPLDLCLHNEENEGRTEEATPTRQRKAREEEGQSFLTQELPQSMMILIGFSSIFLMSSFYYRELSKYLSKYLENSQNFNINNDNIQLLVFDNIWFFIRTILPFTGILIIVVIFFSMIQTKFLFSFKAMKINFSKITPSFKNLKEKTIFSKSQLLQAIKIIFKLIITFTIVGLFIFVYYRDFWKLSQVDIYSSFQQTNLLIYEVVTYLGFFLLVLAIPDWFIQRYQFLKKLKMTKEEVKREIKEMEGDPQIKQKQRERSRALVMKEKEMNKRVAEADVVITNPTHYACAIFYDIGRMDAPKMVAKGVNKVAFKIRKVAEDNNVPIVENKPLAKALYAKVEIDEYIPREFYKAISEIIATLDRFKEKLKRHQQTV